MTATAKPLPVIKHTTNWKDFAATALMKISENILDMVITIAAVGILLSYMLITQPLAAVEYSGYIIGIYLLMILRRIVHDFDDAWTNDEIGDRVASLENKMDDLALMVRNDIITDEEIMERLMSTQPEIKQS